MNNIIRMVGISIVIGLAMITVLAALSLNGILALNKSALEISGIEIEYYRLQNLSKELLSSVNLKPTFSDWKKQVEAFAAPIKNITESSTLLRILTADDRERLRNSVLNASKQTMSRLNKLDQNLSNLIDKYADKLTGLIESSLEFTNDTDFIIAINDIRQLSGYLKSDFEKTIFDLVDLTAAAMEKEQQLLLIRIIFISIVVAAGVVLFLIIIFLIRLKNPLKAIMKKADQIARGNLNIDKITVKNKDELGSLADIFNDMLASLKKFAEQALIIANGNLKKETIGKELKGDLGSAFLTMSNNLREIIGKVRNLIINLIAITNQFDTAFEEQQSSYTEQASAITEVSVTLEELTITAQQITKNTGELVYASGDSIKLLDEGEKSLMMITTQLEEVSRVSKENTVQLENLGKRSILINEMVEIIKSVANKTNMLSINASIEASRAGEAGSGFSVVASEIRELSKETIASAKSVEKAAGEIQNFLNSIILFSESESKKIGETVLSIQTVYNKLKNIVDNTNKNYTFTQKIDVSVHQQETGSKQASETMKQMADISRQNLKVARETTDAVKNIVNLINDINGIIGRFTMDIDQ